MLAPENERFVVSVRDVIKTPQLCACEAFTDGWKSWWTTTTMQPGPRT